MTQAPRGRWEQSLTPVANEAENGDAMMDVIEDLQLVVATMFMITTETGIKVAAVGQGVMNVGAEASSLAW